MQYQKENFNGKYEFRCGYHDGWYVMDNLHEYTEILYCRKGSGTAVINGRVIPMKEKQLVWIPPNDIHQFDFCSAEVICAVFSNDFIPLFFEALGGRRFRVSAVDAGELSGVLDTLYELKGAPLLRIGGYLNLICARVIEQSEFEGAKQTDGVLYQKVISYLSEHYTESVTLSQVAKLFGYNEKYLSHALHNLTGIHFRQILNLYRINHARRLLEGKENTPIATVAAESGFEALNTFNREFKKTTGLTPTEYRKKFK